MPEFTHPEVGGIIDKWHRRQKTCIRGIFVIQVAQGIAISGHHRRLFVDGVAQLDVKFGVILVVAARLIPFETIALEQVVAVSISRVSEVLPECEVY